MFVEAVRPQIRHCDRRAGIGPRVGSFLRRRTASSCRIAVRPAAGLRLRRVILWRIEGPGFEVRAAFAGCMDEWTDRGSRSLPDAFSQRISIRLFLIRSFLCMADE